MKTTSKKTIEKESKKQVGENQKLGEVHPVKNKTSMNDHRKEHDSVESIQDIPAEEQQHEKEPKKK